MSTRSIIMAAAHLAIDPPSLDLNFMTTPGALPPGVTFARSTTGTYFDSNGVLQTAAINAPRWNYNPVTKALNGLLIEEARTNSLRNSMMTGAVPGTPGTMPTNWWSALSAGLALNVIGTGIESGITYIDLRLVGTATSGTLNYIMFDLPGNIPASASQIWSNSVYVKLQAGSTTNIIQINIAHRSSGASDTFGPIIYPSNAALTNQRWSQIVTTPASTTSVFPYILITIANPTVAIDITLRIGALQAELGEFITSYIPTTTTALARAADISSTPIGAWYNQTIGSLVSEAVYNGSTGFPRTVELDDGTANNLIAHLIGSASFKLYSTSTAAGVAGWNLGPNGNFTLNIVEKQGTSWVSGLQTYVWNGSASVGSVVTTIPSGLTIMRIGCDNTNGSQASKYMRRIRYWPRALSIQELQWETRVIPASLDLNFLAPGALPSGVTFTRTTTATYFDSTGILQTAAINAPRWNYNPNTLALNGLLIEEFRTNLILQSKFATSWSVGATILTPNAVTSIDGSVSAAILREDNTNAAHFAYQQITKAASILMYAVSIFVKNGSGSRNIALQLDDGGSNGVNCYVNPITGAIVSDVTSFGTGWTGTSATYTTINNGWGRITFTVTTSNATILRSVLYLANGVSRTYTGDNISNIQIDGFQIELGPYPTSFIPTTTTAVTRQSDNCTLPIGTWFNQFNSSMMGEFIVAQSPNLSNARDCCALTDGSTNNRLMLRAQTNGAANALVGSSFAGVNTFSTTLGNPAINTPTRIAGAWNSANGVGSLNGGATVSYNSGLPGNLNSLGIGNDTLGLGTFLNGHVRRITYWPRTLSNTELQNITS